MNAPARQNGALVYPDDPEGEGRLVWLERKDWKQVLEAGRANAPIFPADSGLVGQVTHAGLEVRLASRGAAPFAVSLSFADNGAGYKAMVSSAGSTLQALGFNPNDTIEIAGFDVWRPVAAGNVAYLRGTVETGIWEVFIGDEWAEDLPPFIMDEENVVTHVYRLIARFEFDDAGGALRVRQILRSALRLENRLESGVYLVYPVTL